MANVIRVSVMGTLPGGEVWSINPCFGLLAPGTDVGYEDCLAIATAVDTLAPPAGLLAVMNSNTAITGSRVEARLWDGTLQAQAEHSRTFGVAGAGSQPHPFQTSLVVSLRTLLPGARGRGRLYFPATGLPLSDSSLRPTTAAVTAFLSGCRTYLSAIETQVALVVPDARLIVWSRTNEMGAYVNRLMAGDVMDTQRRRRDSLSENYQLTTYPS